MTTSESAGVVFDGSGLGEWTDEERFSVTAERIAEYAAATNDPITAHRDGSIAPPVFAVVPVFTSMAPAALSVAPVELLMKLVHGEQDFRFHRPIRAGDELVVRAKPIGYLGKPNGSTVVVYAETRDAAGELVNEQWLTAFFRKVDAGPGEGETAPEHRITDADRAQDPVATVTAHIDEDQTFRYSPASGDPMPIHLDDEIARMAGLPGIINHGLCTMAFTSWAALTELADGDTARLRRLAVRFAKPVLPGQDITTTLWPTDSGAPGVTAYAFETEAAGQIAITDGRVEFN
ncbi:MaoC/PaaZ C-terminal domain-containing protein [Nocardia mangyaensis]|uniref:MaoC/PaaZ C-terminal domain-containing protein n=1 Tax=Nocardia mangyaensis TaxID=2213200 RepID=UPI0026748F27|nr:MaoC/PaaZ C-terminal domain-containing protein [Nocardia mangyaensis]MDO3647888.1 MaoC/PaaZ C-terminal domain-containing protein [Nocardia mangyaensis]